MEKKRNGEFTPISGSNDDWPQEAKDAFSTLEKLASHGHAPLYMCTPFAVGNEKRLTLLKKRYLAPPLGSIWRTGNSAEKFVVGEYGSGKSHFLSQLLEMAKGMNYVTAMVKLDVNSDMSSSTYMLSRVAAEIVAPNGKDRGLTWLIEAIVENFKHEAGEFGGNEERVSELVNRRIQTVEQHRFEQNYFGKVAACAFKSCLEGNLELGRDAIAWMSGNISDARITRNLGVTRYTSTLSDGESRKILFSICQLVRLSGYPGTIISFDEMDQRWKHINDRHRAVIFSLLQSQVNKLTDTPDLAVLVAYSLVKDIYENIMEHPALQGRVMPPSSKLTFEKGNAGCPTIMISRPSDMTDEEIQEELTQIGMKLVDMFYTIPGEHSQTSRAVFDDLMKKLARETMEEDISSGNRRTMVKRAASVLVNYLYCGEVLDTEALKAMEKEEEIE